MGKIIIVEDSGVYLSHLQRFLASKGYKTIAATTIAAGKELIAEAEEDDIVLSDYRFEKSNGLDLLRWLNAEGHTNPFILMTEFSMYNINTEAIRLGAAEYIPKEYLDANIMDMLAKIRKRQEMKLRTKPRIMERKSWRFSETYRKVRLVARTSMPVLILGESGTGKEHIAAMIHERSDRRNKPMQSVNCACLSDELAGSELFGHEEGAFTNAINKRKGLFELADKSTLFLDEVGTLSPKVQQMLLRVLQEGTFRTVGGNDYKQINVRVVCATNEDLKTAVAEKRFREDLFFRLKEMVIRIPPLRECKEDILPLAEHFLEDFNDENNLKVSGFDKEVQKLLLKYSWPGNVRELKQVVRSAALMTQEGTVTADLLSIEDDRHEIATSFAERKKQVERERLEWALKEAGGNKRKASEILGISPTTLYDWLNKCGIPLK